MLAKIKKTAEFLREKTNQLRNQTLQLLSQEQAEKLQVIWFLNTLITLTHH